MRPDFMIFFVVVKQAWLFLSDAMVVKRIHSSLNIFTLEARCKCQFPETNDVNQLSDHRPLQMDINEDQLTGAKICPHDYGGRGEML